MQTASTRAGPCGLCAGRDPRQPGHVGQVRQTRTSRWRHVATRSPLIVRGLALRGVRLLSAAATLTSVVAAHAGLVAHLVEHPSVSRVSPPRPAVRSRGRPRDGPMAGTIRISVTATRPAAPCGSAGPVYSQKRAELTPSPRRQAASGPLPSDRRRRARAQAHALADRDPRGIRVRRGSRRCAWPSTFTIAKTRGPAKPAGSPVSWTVNAWTVPSAERSVHANRSEQHSGQNPRGGQLVVPHAAHRVVQSRPSASRL